MKRQQEETVANASLAEPSGAAGELEQALALTIGHMRSLHATLTVLMTEVAAIRRTVLDGPEHLARYRDNLKAAQEVAKPIVDESMESFDEMLRKVSGDGWEN